MRKMTLGIIMCIIGLIMLVPTIVKHVEFRQNCSGYIKQAANAGSVEMCLERLDKAIDYAYKKGWTEGYTSVIYKTEDENVGFWFENLKLCHYTLVDALDEQSLTQSNALMRVRECLTDNGANGTHLTIPTGLLYYPNNIAWGGYRLVLVLLLIGGVVVALCDDEIIWL